MFRIRRRVKAMPKNLFMSRVMLVLILVSFFTFLVSNKVAASTVVTYLINASKDDAWSEIGDVRWDTDGYYLSSPIMRAGCRWRIHISKGALILNANLICRAKNYVEGANTKVRIAVFDQDSCADFDEIFWNWPVMSEGVDWQLPDPFLPDMWYTSPDLKTIIQAYIDKPGYDIGNYIGLRIKFQSGMLAGQEVLSWDFDPDSAAKLEITYMLPLEPPVVSFSYTPENPIVNETVTFDATASYSPHGSIVKYSWNFGDATPIVNRTDPIIFHNYTTPGFYNVTLTVTDSNELTNSTMKKIRIRGTGEPVASFAYWPEQPIVNETVTFNASSSYDPDGVIVSYEWNLGDGTNATGIVVNHSYNSNGVYMITLKVIDNDDMTDYKYGFISVSKHPIASFEYFPITPVLGEVVTFNASTSTPDGGFLVTYVWNFGDNASIPENDPITTHTYLKHGNYNVTLNVTDSEGLWDVVSKSITVWAPPFAFFTYSPTTPVPNESITFDASSSYDPDGNVTSYTWDFGDGNITYTTVNIITHTYLSLGNYSVSLTVTDNHGFTNVHKDSLKVSRSLKANFAFSPMYPLEGEAIIFDATPITPNGGDIISYMWNFGDGNISIVTTPVIIHKYRSFGNYEVTLNVTDSEGLRDTESKLITIDAQPVPSFVFSPTHPTPNKGVFFNATDSYDPDGTIVNFIWNLGDGNITITSSSVITHIYHEYGDFSVTLTAIDNDGYNDSTSQVINVHVHDVAILTITVSQTDVHIGQVINITVTARNEGTTTESFNVTVFRNETLIGTQLVSNLAPDAEKILNFYWNTSDVTDTADFSIEAEADVVSGESDILDNNYASDIVKVSDAPRSSFSVNWNWILPILIPPILFFAAGIWWKKTRTSQKFRDFDFFDEITDGGIPDSFSVLITGEPGSGKSVLCQQLPYTFLTREKSCIYITYDSFPDEVRENMEKFHWNISKYENEEKFVFIDSFSSIAKVISKEKYSLNQPFSLSDLGITMSKATSEVADAPRVFLDSIVPLLTHIDPSKVVEFLQNRSARIKGVKGTFIFTLGKETIEPNLISRLEEVVDCVIELEVSKGKTGRRMRIKKMRGRETSSKWVRFEINSEKGIVFLA